MVAANQATSDCQQDVLLLPDTSHSYSEALLKKRPLEWEGAIIDGGEGVN